MDVSDIQKQLDMGEPIEHEHTKDHKLAMDIALQHLDEIPDYYTRLKKMEADAKKEHKKFKDVKEDAVMDLQKGLTELEDASYDSVDSLMRRIMKKRGMSAKQLHNKFVSRNNKTPDAWIKDQKMKEEMETQKFCKLCRKVETKNECKYGPEMWDKYTRPQEMLSQNQVKYNTNRPHPANENVTIEDANGNTFIEIVDLIKPEPLVKEAKKMKGEDPCWKGYEMIGKKKKGGKEVPNCVPKEGKSFDSFMTEASAAWQRKEGKNSEGGLNKKGIASYRKEHPGSKLSLAVTTEPSKLKKGSKSANRRKSFCSRMSGMKKKLTSAKTANDPNSRINKSLRKWNC